MDIKIREYKDTDLYCVFSLWEQRSANRHCAPFDSIAVSEECVSPGVFLATGDTWVLDLDGEVSAFITMSGTEITATVVHPKNDQQIIANVLISYVVARNDELEVAVLGRDRLAHRVYDEFGFACVEKYKDHLTGDELFWLRRKC